VIPGIGITYAEYAKIIELNTNINLRVGMPAHVLRWRGPIAAGPTYFIGRRAEHGSYNLHYFGTIEKITAKTVTIGRDGREASRRLKIEEFARRNVNTPASKADANAETMMSI